MEKDFNQLVRFSEALLDLLEFLLPLTLFFLAANDSLAPIFPKVSSIFRPQPYRFGLLLLNMHELSLIPFLNAYLLCDIPNRTLTGILISNLNFCERDGIHHFFDLFSVLEDVLRRVVEVNYL